MSQNKEHDDIARLLAIENLKVMEETVKAGSGSPEIYFRFLTFYIERMVVSALNGYKKKNLTEKEAYEFTAKNFTLLKSRMQSAVAEGFEEAIGPGVDYYCQINIVPEPINKEPC